MTVDSSTGDVYLADEHKIDRLGADGKLTTIAGARRAYEAKLEPVPNTFSIGSGPETGPATTFRFQFLQGIAFVPDTGDLYAIDAGRLVRIDRQGTLTVLPRADLSVSGALAYDPRRKKLYTGAKSLVTGNSGIARIDLTGEALILSGSDSASSVTDQLAVDSRGNAYYLFNGTDDITVIGDLLSETRIDLKKRPA
jgi:DNA-binding beta-propeller fold protein YncE